MLQGSLLTFDEDKRLVAFVSPQPLERTEEICILVVIGGLTDGLMALPYVTNLQKRLLFDDENENEDQNEDGKRYHLVQPILSSSYVGYGGASIKQDVEELKLLISCLKQTFNVGRLSVLGHSTGAVDAVYLAAQQQQDVVIDKFILQGPVSDRLYAEANLAGYEELVQLARDMIQSGRGQEWMPRRADPYSGAAITADRFISMLGKGEQEDVFSPDFKHPVWEQIGCLEKFSVILSDKDEYCDGVEEARRFFASILPKGEDQIHVIPNANHAISKGPSQAHFIDTLINLLSYKIRFKLESYSKITRFDLLLQMGNDNFIHFLVETEDIVTQATILNAAETFYDQIMLNPLMISTQTSLPCLPVQFNGNHHDEQDKVHGRDHGTFKLH